MIRRLLLAMPCALLTAGGCSVAERTDASRVSPEYAGRPELSQSLFAADQAVMDDATIERILSSRIAVPSEVRIVVLNFGPERYRYWWSEETAELDQAAVGGCLGKLRESDRVGYVQVLPSMLAPAEQTIPHFRRAAARCQADLIFIYRSHSEIYRKERILAHDKARSYCQVEAVLVDTRTGLVPFSSARRKSYTAEKSEEDFNLAETTRKAELRALDEALAEIADELVAFLESMPRSGKTPDHG